MNEAIGRELKLTRIGANLKLKKVADDFEINPETLRRYEKNSNGLSVEKLEKFLFYYGVNRLIFFTNVCAYMHKKQKNINNNK